MCVGAGWWMQCSTKSDRRRLGYQTDKRNPTGIDALNNYNRKVWGGNRTAAGASAQGVLMSVFETCRRQAHSVVDHVSRTLRWFGNRLLPRPVLFGG